MSERTHTQVGETIDEYLTRRARTLEVFGKRVRSKGYLVLPARGKRDAICVCVEQLVKDWERRAGHRVPIVYLQCDDYQVDVNTPFSVRLPKTRKWVPLCTAIELFCKFEKRGPSGRRWGGTTEGAGVLTRTTLTVDNEYQGTGTDALKLLLRLLDIPQHRAIMCGDDPNTNTGAGHDAEL